MKTDAIRFMSNVENLKTLNSCFNQVNDHDIRISKSGRVEVYCRVDVDNQPQFGWLTRNQLAKFARALAMHEVGKTKTVARLREFKQKLDNIDVVVEEKINNNPSKRVSSSQKAAKLARLFYDRDKKIDKLIGQIEDFDQRFYAALEAAFGD